MVWACPCVLVHKNVLQVTELATVKSPTLRLKAVLKWQTKGGVLIMGYDMYRILSQDHKIDTEEQKKLLKSALVDPGSETL